MNNVSEEVEFAKRIRSALDQGTTTVDEKVSLRLYEARCDALRHQPVPVAATGIASFGHILAQGWHNHHRGILAFIALVIGALGVQLWQTEQEATELADIDSELLSDEVPPSAYTDQGFLEWLNRLSESEEESFSE
jgi:hypothetical protein